MGMGCYEVVITLDDAFVAATRALSQGIPVF